MKRNEVLVHAITWVNLENVMVRERRQVTEDHILFSLYELPRMDKPIETESTVAAAKGWGREWK